MNKYNVTVCAVCKVQIMHHVQNKWRSEHNANVTKREMIRIRSVGILIIPCKVFACKIDTSVIENAL